MWKMWLCAGVVVLVGRRAWATEYRVQELGSPTDRQTVGAGLNDSDQALVGVYNPGWPVTQLYSGGTVVQVGPGGGAPGFEGDALDDAGDMVGRRVPEGYGAIGETYVYSGGTWTDVQGSGAAGFMASTIVPTAGGGAVAGGKTDFQTGNSAMVVRDGRLEAVPGYDGVVAGNASGDLLLSGGVTGIALMHADGTITAVDPGLGTVVSPEALTAGGAILGLRPGTVSNGGVRSFVYAGGKTTYLPSEVDGLGDTVFMDMNDAGVAVGTAEDGSPHPAAAIYENGQAHLLQDVVENAGGWDLMQANYVNADGWILGFGTDPSGSLRAYLLTPVDESGPASGGGGDGGLPAVPEPLAILLLPLSLAGLCGRETCRRRWG